MEEENTRSVRMEGFLSTLTPASALLGGGADGEDASPLIIAFIPLAVAAVGLAGALLVHYRTQRAASRDRKRQVSSKALADALAWMEIPYRIRRRVGDDPQTLSSLVERIHGLQEALLFHMRWLRVELPEAYHEYHALITAVQTVTRDAIQDAWNTPAASSPAAMNIGSLPIDRQLVDGHVEKLSEIIRRRFG